MKRIAIPMLWALVMLAARFVDPLPVIGAGAVAMAAVVAWRERRTMRTLFRVTPRIALLAVVSAAVMLAATWLLFPLAVNWVPQIGTETRIIYSRFIFPHTFVVLIAGIVPVVIAEEILWRGAFQGSLGRASIIIAAMTYAIAHAPAGSLLLVVVALVCGLYWSALRAISGSLIPSLCAHLVWDIVLIAIPLTR